MERIVNAEYAELIGYAIYILPSRIWDRIKYVHFFTGTDPIYAGLHDYIETNDNNFKSEGETYRNICHVAYPHHQLILPSALRNTTVILPYLPDPAVVIHELGHVLDETLDFSHVALPITEYAKVNEAEAFAEALVGWLFEDSGEPDEETRCLFEFLAWG